MIDLSDGLASDLRHICRASGVGAVVEADRLPLSPALEKAAGLFGVPPVEIALRGGEDYQLLFTVPPRLRQKMETQAIRRLGRNLFLIGEMTREGRILLRQDGRIRPLRWRGFDHFSR